MGSLSVKTGGVWKTITNVKAKYNGSWTQVKQVYAKMNGVWKPVWTYAVETTSDAPVIEGPTTASGTITLDSPTTTSTATYSTAQDTTATLIYTVGSLGMITNSVGYSVMTWSGRTIITFTGATVKSCSYTNTNDTVSLSNTASTVTLTGRGAHNTGTLTVILNVTDSTLKIDTVNSVCTYATGTIIYMKPGT